MPMGSVPLARRDASNSLCMTLGSTGVYLTTRGPPAPPSLPNGAVHANNTVASTSEEVSCSMAGRSCVAPAALRATRLREGLQCGRTKIENSINQLHSDVTDWADKRTLIDLT